MSDRLPRHERKLQAISAELVDLYEPDLVPGESYEIESIVVPVEKIPGYPPVALRLSGFDGPVSAQQVDDWVEALGRVATTAAGQLR